jgi:hypothetical protein
MSRPSFPWPRGSFAMPFWRTRHTRTGDTTPPSLTQGQPSSTKCVPYVDATASGHYGDFYNQDVRAMGLGEPPTAAIINRATYDLSCALDVLFEQLGSYVRGDNPGSLVPDPGNELDLRDIGTSHAYVIGDENTTTRSGLDPVAWCSNFLKVRMAGAEPIPVIGTAREVVEVADVLAAPGGTSLYAPGHLPSFTQAYPIGTPGVISLITHAGGGADDTITFVSDTPPSGTVLPPAPAGTCFFNYTLLERMLTSASPSIDNCFTICHSSALGPPDVYTVNRDDLGSKGWLSGDYVYTTYFAWQPTLVLNDTWTASKDIVLWAGCPWFGGLTRPSTIPSLLCMMDQEPARSGIPPFTVAEEYVVGGVQRFFDYANALFRGVDSALKGTIGFDFAGDSARAGADRDSYAGFLHRKMLSFDKANNTVLSVQEAVTWVGATVTLTDAPPTAQFYGATSRNRQVLLGVDLLFLEDEVTGDPVGLFILNGIAKSAATILNLDGTIPALAAGTGYMTVCRPEFRTGIWDNALPTFGGGNLMVGDEYLGALVSPLALAGIGGADLLTAWQADAARDQVAAADATLVKRMSVGSTGSITFSGTLDGSATYNSDLQAQKVTSLWKSTGESWSTRLFARDSGGTKDWRDRFAWMHMLKDSLGNVATYLHFDGTNGDDGLATYEHAGIFFGLPGDVYPLADVVTSTAGDRDAGFLYARNNNGSMEVGLGLTTDGGLVLDLQMLENPSPHPPAGPFGAYARRVELQENASYGWQHDITFYHHVAMSDGETRARDDTIWTYRSGFSGQAPDWIDAHSGGHSTEADTAIVFRLNVPDGCTLDSVQLKYRLEADGAFTGRGIRLYVYQEDPSLDAPDTAAAPGVAEPLMGAPGYVESTLTDEDYGVLNYAATAYPAHTDPVVVDNLNKQYYILVTGAYSVLNGTHVTSQQLFALRVKFLVRDLVPA